MDELLALTLFAIALVYAEPLSGGPFFGFVLPLLGAAGMYYLLRLTGTLIVACAAAAYHFMDIASPSIFRSVVLPGALGLCVIAFGIWAWKEGYLTGGSGWIDPGSDGGNGGCGGDGDCGGDGGSC